MAFRSRPPFLADLEADPRQAIASGRALATFKKMIKAFSSYRIWRRNSSSYQF
jgi:hypothetical protein